MIRYVTGDIFSVASVVDAIVNPVNCVGVMGKGLALEFKTRYPENFNAYKQFCKAGMLLPGSIFPFRYDENPKWIVNFSTKNDWRNPSKMQWIIDGLVDLKGWLLVNNIHRIAIPALGAGQGGLLWHDDELPTPNHRFGIGFE